MSNAIWYTPALTCRDCGHTTPPRESRLRSAALNPDPSDRWVTPGDLLDVGLLDLADAFEPSALWPPGPTVRALEAWTCPGCRTTQVALVIFADESDAGWRLVSVESVPMTLELLDGVHCVSQGLRDTMYPEQLARLSPR